MSGRKGRNKKALVGGELVTRSQCWIHMCLHTKVMQQSRFSQPAWQMANRTTLSQSRILMGEFLFLSKATGSKKVLNSFPVLCSRLFYLPFYNLAGIKSYPHCEKQSYIVLLLDAAVWTRPARLASAQWRISLLRWIKTIKTAWMAVSLPETNPSLRITSEWKKRYEPRGESQRA